MSESLHVIYVCMCVYACAYAGVASLLVLTVALPAPLLNNIEATFAQACHTDCLWQLVVAVYKYM